MVPPYKVTLEDWDLNLVLGVLQESPFEPLQDISLPLLSWKVALFVAITSIRRVSELAALSCQTLFLTFHRDKVVLRPSPTFLPKVVSSFHLNEDIVLPLFCPAPMHHMEMALHSLDLVRALRKTNKDSNYTTPSSLKKTKFKKVWTKQSKSSINYVNGRIYFDNFLCCYSSFSCVPQKLYEMPKCLKSEKIEDAILCECALGEPLARASDYTPSIIAVTGHDWLLRIAADTGEVLQKVYLGLHRKFRYVSWDEIQETLVVRSIQKTCVYPSQQSNVVCHMAVFNVFPLSLVGVLEISKNFLKNNMRNGIADHCVC
ncbi:unnamed protein product [Ranitomeya imitator]|uniref:Uncharacterized protein n=1 Tax=Ranitomeya imitator TaxID=111125 RepID=A0ABN9MQG4_9NEOB|nr:unnamed protein product [Ranitomeya imitator]